MSEPEPVEVPSTPRKRGRPRKIPATPTPSKFVIYFYISEDLTVAFRGKKRSINEVSAASDSEASFVVRYVKILSHYVLHLIQISSPIHDSPKKPRVASSTTKKPPATPSKKTPAKAKAATKTKTASPTKVKTTPAASNKATSPSKMPSTQKNKLYVNIFCPGKLPYKIIDCILALVLLLTTIMMFKINNLSSVTMTQGIFTYYF